MLEGRGGRFYIEEVGSARPAAPEPPGLAVFSCPGNAPFFHLVRARGAFCCEHHGTPWWPLNSGAIGAPTQIRNNRYVIRSL